MPSTTFETFTQQADYSLMDFLNADPDATDDGHDHRPREVLSGHYVPVLPTAIPNPEYIAHSNRLFAELNLCQTLPHDERFCRLFSGDITVAQHPMRSVGWATGYALSIYGTEYTQQCPFGTGNGYGDGRAISVFEGTFSEKRWEMQLKGGGRTPYCRGADGRAVLRSSVREFLAQEYMHALGIPTSRSLTLYVSTSEMVRRPWYVEHSKSFNPNIMENNPTAISTRVAPSFIRVGQLELFARRARAKAHPDALRELRMIVMHLIERNYKEDIDPSLPFDDQVVELARLFRSRLVALVSNWIRVGYCQGNFNSDNCAAGGYTLDYGPFGFCEMFDPHFQPWTGGGEHFSFFNQPAAAQTNYHMFWTALRPLLIENKKALAKLDEVRTGFADAMNQEFENMWAKKLGLVQYDGALVSELLHIMVATKADYTMFFRTLSNIPETIDAFQGSFYAPRSAHVDEQLRRWLQRWRNTIVNTGDSETTSSAMKRINPKYAWREWLVAPAYKKAKQGDYSLIRELQSVFNNPYEEQSPEVEAKFDRRRPDEYCDVGGISHYSCSS